jgi:hypothetical protein
VGRCRCSSAARSRTHRGYARLHRDRPRTP